MRARAAGGPADARTESDRRSDRFPGASRRKSSAVEYPRPFPTGHRGSVSDSPGRRGNMMGSRSSATSCRICSLFLVDSSYPAFVRAQKKKGRKKSSVLTKRSDRCGLDFSEKKGSLSWGKANRWGLAETAFQEKKLSSFPRSLKTALVWIWEMRDSVMVRTSPISFMFRSA